MNRPEAMNTMNKALRNEFRNRPHHRQNALARVIVISSTGAFKRTPPLTGPRPAAEHDRYILAEACTIQSPS